MDLLVLMQDADNLQKINRESITRGIVESFSVLRPALGSFLLE